MSGMQVYAKIGCDGIIPFSGGWIILPDLTKNALTHQ